MMTKARVKPGRREPKYTFGPGDHGRAVTDAQVKYARWIEGYHYEIIDGKIYASPFPEVGHDDLRTWIADALQAYSRKHPDIVNQVRSSARVFVPQVGRTTVPEPDVAAYADFPLHIPAADRRWKDTSPLLVAEVVYGDLDKDLTRNVVLYEQVPSIEEYWVFNYWTEDDFFFRVFRKRGKRWRKPVDFELGDVYTTPVLLGFSLRLNPDV